ncbi:permease [Alkalibacter saccharofermentans]|uniref:Predicted permease n=1 Tax=Alkalibacter saccharofermentans DSM 14828 TaxID=1120975 RepID=A0A1M4X4B9_9FIRM|nr:permease [Alkalibacter saccharofermentans]SHE88326.1 Predicted permease [Alkalibacter saccharofermentans DSM 14828]
MDIFTKIFWVIALVLFASSLKKDRQKTFEAMKKSKGMMKNMIGEIIGVIFLIGFILTMVPPESIKDFLGSSNVLFSTIGSAIVGSITLIPAFVAFPLVGSLVDAGASVVPAVAFLTTLTMVGLVTFSLEKKEFGLKFTFLRNSLSFVFAVSIALLMGVVL